jgi:TolA-binding protein
MIVIFFVIGFAILSSVLRSVAGTRVVLDSSQRLATRTDTVFFIPMRRQEMAFNLIRDVQVTRLPGRGAFSLDTLPIWQVQLQATDGSTLTVNERGSRAEMDALAQRVSALLNRPVRQERESRSEVAAEATYTPATVVTSLFTNLAEFAQSVNTTNVAPPVAAPDRARRDSPSQAERIRPETMPRRPRTPPAPANTFSVTPPAVNADAPFAEASTNLAQGEAAAIPYNPPTIPFSGFEAPPVLVMPELPGLMTFAPAMDLPSFPALGSAFASETSTLYESNETKEVEAQVTMSAPPAPRTVQSAMRGEAAELYQAARQLYAAGNLRDAEANLLRALSTNPADAAIHNDLGVTYYRQNKTTEAERAFRRAVALEPFARASRYNLGMVLQRLGRRSEANEQFKVGAQDANQKEAALFRDALRGFAGAPLLSS